MTIPAFAETLGSRLPSASEKEAANQLRTIIAAHVEADTKLRVLDEGKNTREVILTPGLSSILLELLRHIGRGDAVTLVPIGQMLSTQQAADILNVSRPYFISLLEKREIEHSLVGRHRRVKAEDLFAYKRNRDRERAKALSDMAAIDADLL